MNIDDILSTWEEDCKIDKTELGDEALRLFSLHHKYHKIFTNERLILKKQESDFKQLRLEKHEFYSQGHTEETRKKGWELPAKGMILKSDLAMYVEADKDIINLSLKIGLQQEKIQILDSILKVIMNRSFPINAAITWQKFINGG